MSDFKGLNNSRISPVGRDYTGDEDEVFECSGVHVPETSRPSPGLVYKDVDPTGG